MCGITGYLLNHSTFEHPCQRLAQGGLLTHRGPDAFSEWTQPEAGIGLQHYRLAILELSPAGSQPMRSSDGRYTIVFNGEIYNHLALRQQLSQQGHDIAWRGHSDTETLLACIQAWGLATTLKAAVGMFAIGLHDRATRTLTLARDRLGEKPLYYGLLRGALVFASEMKALRAIDPSAMRLHAGAVAAFMRYGYVPGTQSIYEGISRLPPGCWLAITQEDVSRGTLPAPQAYWRALDLPQQQGARQGPTSDEQEVELLDGVLRQAVRDQMLADVPLGALLSGGVDSSIVVAMMQAQASRPVKTFAIGFGGDAVDEAPHARRVARHLGTEHTELYVSPQDALDLVPAMPGVFCEPFADSSQLPTQLVARLAKQHVTVALSGDGGDELFAGYDRYLRVERGFARLRGVPPTLRKVGACVLERVPAGVLNAVVRGLGNPGQLRNPADRLKKMAAVLASKDAATLNQGLISLWNPAELMPGTVENASIFGESLPHAATLMDQLMLADTLCYLPDDLLVKVDRTAMAVSLETRAPFLDHRVVEHAWHIPIDRKIRHGSTKWVLKEVLSRYLPRELYERPKQGFGSPIDEWLRGSLRDWADTLLSPTCLQTSGLLNASLIQKRWREHQAGTRNWQHSLWCVLMFQAWLQSQS